MDEATLLHRVTLLTSHRI